MAARGLRWSGLQHSLLPFLLICPPSASYFLTGDVFEVLVVFPRALNASSWRRDIFWFTPVFAPRSVFGKLLEWMQRTCQLLNPR